MGAAITPANSDWFWDGLDSEVAETLSDNQKSAITTLIRSRAPTGTPVDIRLSFGRFFFVFMFGRERRNKQRLKVERATRPVFTVRNFPAIVAIWIALIYMTLTLLSALSYLVFGILS